MIKVMRTMLCDGADCPAANLEIFEFIELDPPDWKGWQEFPAAAGAEHTGPRHLCPACVARGNPISDQNE